MTALYMYLKTWGATVARSERGASMVEYGLLVALIAIVVAVGAGLLGTAIDGLFDDTTATLKGEE